MKIFLRCACTSISSESVWQIYLESNKLWAREDHIFVNVIRDKNKNGWYQTEKSIIGPVSNFNKRFKMQSLKKTLAFFFKNLWS